ncbi:uncharacterized protein BDR25DRAFT_356519 [Lindgomyces ingoldianus]|uniref:Uncharacterized protein n=1 Tax=Lindgomyces ingoldianus TaxID=673940 RepID=A0ACB6QQI6_9PLEO|nr:uncharacterized protein BDR25DRAFT_356519 [Lindgomyces ingoldianus]KAF2469279.1 hypothetical protein BDR25DRAFT_356519 [Lindgomyces ingoldianus]
MSAHQLDLTSQALFSILVPPFNRIRCPRPLADKCFLLNEPECQIAVMSKIVSFPYHFAYVGIAPLLLSALLSLLPWPSPPPTSSSPNSDSQQRDLSSDSSFRLSPICGEWKWIDREYQDKGNPVTKGVLRQLPIALAFTWSIVGPLARAPSRELASASLSCSISRRVRLNDSYHNSSIILWLGALRYWTPDCTKTRLPKPNQNASPRPAFSVSAWFKHIIRNTSATRTKSYPITARPEDISVQERTLLVVGCKHHTPPLSNLMEIVKVSKCFVKESEGQLEIFCLDGVYGRADDEVHPLTFKAPRYFIGKSKLLDNAKFIAHACAFNECALGSEMLECLRVTIPPSQGKLGDMIEACSLHRMVTFLKTICIRYGSPSDRGVEEKEKQGGPCKRSAGYSVRDKELRSAVRIKLADPRSYIAMSR